MFFVDAASTLPLVTTPPSPRKLVDVRQQLPAEWATLAEQAGIPGSFRAIAARAGVATTTVTRMITEGRTSPESITAVAKALGIDEARVYELVGVSVHPTLGLWSPPEAAHQLDGAERSVLEDLIRVMAKGEDSASRQLKAEKSRGGVVDEGIPSGPDATVHQLPERRVAKRPSKEERERRRKRDEDADT